MDCSYLQEEYAQALLDANRAFRAVQEWEEKRTALQMESGAAWTKVDRLKERILIEALRA